MPARPYQQKAIEDIRAATARCRRICYQCATGSGKTYTFSLITQLAQAIGNSVWIVVPRNHLVDQASEHLKAINVPHAQLTAGKDENRAFSVHVCSLQTLLRRIENRKIKNWPAIIIFDECHENLDAQLLIHLNGTKHTVYIGVTATPERMDGRGLGLPYGMYETLILGPTEQELIELDYLANIRYFKAPEIKGMDDLKRVQTENGIEYDRKQVEAIFKNRAVWGDMVSLFKQYRQLHETALIFCRSVELSDQTEKEFQDAGYRIFSIHGKTPIGKQKELLKMARAGEIDGLCTCDLLIYGIDIKRIEFILSLRFTGSYAYYKQFIGRGMRPWSDPVTGRKKEFCTVVDPVGNFNQHGHPLTPHIWNFKGVEKRRHEKTEHADVLRLCTNCGLYYDSGHTCPHCHHERDGTSRKGLVAVDGRLVEAEPIKLAERPLEEKREFQDRISGLVSQFQESSIVDCEIVGRMLEIASELGNKPLWVYHRLNANRHMVNTALLWEIQRQAKKENGESYKPGVVHFWKQELSKRTG